MDHTKDLTHISLCAGYGGIDLGLRGALEKIRTICYVEIGAFPIHNLVAKIEKGLLDECPIFTDLKTFPWEHFNRRVDILSGGFPCQPFSCAGEQAGDKDPRHLWPYITDGIERLGRPPIVFFENVLGILSSDITSSHWNDDEGTPVLLHIHREMERLGYRTTSGIFSANEVGAPHLRKRIFILGVRADLAREGWDHISALLGHGAESGGGDMGCDKTDNCTATSRGAWPASRGTGQYAWEPSRVISKGVKLADSGRSGLQGADDERGHTAGQSSGGIHTEEGSLDNADSQRLHQSDGRPDQEETGKGETDHPSMSACFVEELGCEEGSQSAMGGDLDGLAHWMGTTDMHNSSDSATDELRLLGNGVVPACAEYAFGYLFKRLCLAYSNN